MLIQALFAVIGFTLAKDSACLWVSFVSNMIPQQDIVSPALMELSLFKEVDASWAFPVEIDSIEISMDHVWRLMTNVMHMTRQMVNVLLVKMSMS